MEVLNDRFGNCHAKKRETAAVAKITTNGRRSIQFKIFPKDRRMEIPFSTTVHDLRAIQRCKSDDNLNEVSESFSKLPMFVCS